MNNTMRFWSIGVWLCCLSTIHLTSCNYNAAPSDQQERMRISYAEIVERAYTQKWKADKRFLDEKTFQWSTADRNSIYNEETGLYEGWDANDDGSFKVRDEANNSVLIDIQGCGYVSRMWFGTIYKGGTIGIIIDSTEVVNMDLLEYVVGENSSEFSSVDAYIDAKAKDYHSKHEFPKLSYLSSKGFNTFVPLSFNKSLKIYLKNDTPESRYDAAWFKQINYTLFPEGTEVEPFSGFPNMQEEHQEALRAANDILAKRNDYDVSSFESIRIEAKSKVVLLEDKGRKAINETMLYLGDSLTKEQAKEALRNLSLNIYYDGNEYPSTSVSVGDFFNSPSELAENNVFEVGCESGVLYAKWFIPYRKIRVEMVNNGEVDYDVKYRILTEKVSRREMDNYLVFNVSHRRLTDRSSTSDRWPDATTFQATGRGRVIGQTLHTFQRYVGFWWGEGDERYFVDGEKFPSWYGTGAEDQIGYSWSIPISWAFSGAFRAHPVGAGNHGEPGDKVNISEFGGQSVAFRSAIEMAFEKYFDDDYCFVGATTFYYIDKENLAENKPQVYDVNYRNSYAPLSLAEMPAAELLRYEGEHVVSTMKVSRGVVYEQWLGPSVSGNKHGCWFDVGDGSDKATMKFPIFVGKEGNYRLRTRLFKARDYATFNCYIDDILLESNINLYHSSTGQVRRDFGLHPLSAGQHVVTFEVSGSDSRCDTFNGGKYVFGMDYFDVIPEGLVRFESYDLYEAEKTQTAGELRVETRDLTGITGAEFFTFLNSDGKDGALTFRLKIEEEGDYSMDINFTKAIDFPIVHVFLDGTEVGKPVDLYHPGLKGSGPIHYGTHHLKAGTHTVTFRTPEKNEQSRGYVYSIDYIDFRKQ